MEAKQCFLIEPKTQKERLKTQTMKKNVFLQIWKNTRFEVEMTPYYKQSYFFVQRNSNAGTELPFFFPVVK